MARILEARARGGRLRALGSGGSKSEVTAVPGEGVLPPSGDALLRVDGDRVTVAPGVTTYQLQALLRERGLTLPTVGEWRNATLGGAILTGTHGGSARHGIMAASLRGLRVVSGAGDVHVLSPGDEDFRHVPVSFGALGVVTSLTLVCEPHFSLRMETDVVPFREYGVDPVAQESRSEFHSSIWVPTAARVIRFAADRAPAPGSTVRRRARFGRWTAMANFLARRFGLHAAVSPRIFARTALGDCADILSPLDVPPRVARLRNRLNGRRGRRAAELAVPARDAAAALARFQELFLKYERTLNNPIGLRMSAADDFTLSPCQGRDTLWLDVFYDASPAFEEALAEVAGQVDARCHWGKTLALAPSVLRARYPGWADFHAARNRLDPDQVFANPFTDLLGLTDRGGAGEGRRPGEGDPS
ncbi:MAG: D-arabinono-1,4-lactone oxidase [Longimicrobiales bacterium]|nr:D-arabinono-1,4-lactone oxidase [Longimicrobiales bacterium]